MIYILFFLLLVLALPTIVLLFGTMFLSWKVKWTPIRPDNSEDCDLSDLK
jgi:hypothetical protein